MRFTGEIESEVNPLFAHGLKQCILCSVSMTAKIIFDRNTGRSRGFGFISFTSVDDAQTALAGMDGKVSDHLLITPYCLVPELRSFPGSPAPACYSEEGPSYSWC